MYVRLYMPNHSYNMIVEISYYSNEGVYHTFLIGSATSYAAKAVRCSQMWSISHLVLSYHTFFFRAFSHFPIFGFLFLFRKLASVTYSSSRFLVQCTRGIFYWYLYQILFRVVQYSSSVLPVVHHSSSSDSTAVYQGTINTRYKYPWYICT